MGLHDFVHLQWNTTIGTLAECVEFVNNTTPVVALVGGGEVIHLLEEDVAAFFHLGVGETKDIAARARSWQSQKFTAPKEKNGYKLNTCTDKNLVERLEFIRAAIYLQERRNVITGVQVREAEEVRGGSNWAKHLFKQLHHELEVAKTTKKCKAGSHIRIIFLALEREKKKKEAAKEDAPPGFPAPQGTKVLQGFGMTTPAGGAKSAMWGAAGAKAKPPPKKIIVKAKPPQPNPRQILGIKKDIEIQVLTNTNNNFKAIIDSNDKELLELGKERDEAVLDAANATSKVEALTEKIQELEGKLSALRSVGSAPNKRPRLLT
ncbi:unnamed protein product [Calypogeia fissa]